MLPEDNNNPVPDETALYRRINPEAPQLVWDENRGCQRISTGAFGDPDLSVAIGDTLEALGRDPATVLDGYTGQYLVSFAAVTATNNGLAVLRDPTSAEPAHGVVSGKKRMPVRRALAASCVWVVRPDNGCEPPYADVERPSGEPNA